MKQFTSKFNFSLTKKRFRMMSKKFSHIRSGIIWMFLLPTLSITSFVFCEKRYVPSHPYYSDVKLDWEVVGRTETGGFIHKLLDEDGIPYTGTRRFYDFNTDKLINISEIVDGERIKTFAFNEHFDSTGYAYEYAFFNGNWFRSKTYTETGSLLIERIGASEEEPGHIREWHSNGQLKFEVGWNINNEYEGLMTLYDQQGNTLEQELYENGTLVEKIK